MTTPSRGKMAMEKHKARAVASALVATVTLTGVLAGCGSSGANGTQGQNGTGAGQTGNVPSGQHITVWSWAGGPQLQDVKKIADEWAKAHGDTVTVIDQSSNPKGFQWYATAARTSTGPDVVFGMPHDNNGTFAIEGLMAQVPDGFLNTSDYNPNTIQAVTINGKVYSVPVSVQAAALYYNKAMVPTPPKTWDEFVQDANAHGFMYDQANLYFDYAIIGGMGGYVFKNNNGTLDPNDIGLATPGAVQAYQLMYDMDHKYHWMTPTTNGQVAKAEFLNKKIGMYISGPWDTGDIKKAGIDYGVAPWPSLPNGQSATPFLGVITAFVNSKSKTQAADWSLVQALTDKEAQLTYFNDSQQIPALLSAQQSPDIQNDPVFKAFSVAVQHAQPMPNIPQMQAVWNAMSVLQNIIAGKVSPQQGGQDFVNNVKKGIALMG